MKINMNGATVTLLVIAAGLSSSVLFMHGLLGSYTRLIADDFCSVYYAERFGLLRSIWYWRLNWSGRYSAFGMDWLLTRVIRIDNLPYVLPILLVAWFSLASYAIYRVLHSEETKRQDVLFSGLLGIVYLSVLFGLTPNIPQSFYWWNGMRSYTLPLIFLTAYLALFLILPPKKIPIKTQIILSVLFFILLFTSGGMGETTVVFQIGLLVLLILSRWLLTFRLNWDIQLLALISGLLGSIAALVVIITAPGNSIRQEVMPPTINPTQLLAISWEGFSVFLIEIIQTPEKITLLIGSFLIAVWIGHYYKDRFEVVSWMIPVCLAGGLLLSFACFIPGAYGYSEPPPTRVIILPVFALSIIVMFSGFLTGIQLHNISSLPDLGIQILLLTSVSLLAYSSAIQTGDLYNKKNQYVSFADSWDKMDIQIRTAKNNQEESITLPFVNNWAMLNTLTDNPNFWVNVCYSNYYGIDVLGEFPFTF